MNDSGKDEKRRDITRLEQYVVDTELIYSLDRYGEVGILKIEKRSEKEIPSLESLKEKYNLIGVIQKEDNIEAIIFGEVPIEIEIIEGDLKFIINPYKNFEGLPIDQKIFRKTILEYSINKDVLVLFANAGFNTMYSLLGGAKSVDSVDQSRDNISLLERNLNNNHIFKEEPGTRLGVWEDNSLNFIDFAIESETKYDLVILDLSSYAIDEIKDFDVYKDHAALVRKIQKKLLNYAGYVFLISDLKKFVLDQYIRPGADKLTKTSVPKEYLPTRPHQSFVFYN